MKLHPEFFEKTVANKKRRFVMIPLREYQFLKARWRDYEELRNLDEAAAEARAKAGLRL